MKNGGIKVRNVKDEHTACCPFTVARTSSRRMTPGEEGFQHTYKQTRKPEAIVLFALGAKYTIGRLRVCVMCDVCVYVRREFPGRRSIKRSARLRPRLGSTAFPSLGIFFSNSITVKNTFFQTFPKLNPLRTADDEWTNVRKLFSWRDFIYH